ncbi:transcriptional regulator [Streptomyces subrutilus]|nr:transcriptional regulator [Streptomyces subrutilus]
MTRKAAVAAKGLKTLSEAQLLRIEKGELNFRRNVGDLKILLKRYGVTDEDLVESLVELNRDAPSEDWLTGYRSSMPTGMPHFVGLEAEAEALLVYHPTIVAGLLQTPAYARALFEVNRPVEDTTGEFVKNGVDVRMERKKRVLEREDPPKLRVILGEAALLTPYGGPDVMADQYQEIIRLVREKHISVQVLLTAKQGYRASHDFTVMDLGSGLPPRVQTDNAWGAVSTSDKLREVNRFTRRFETMVGVALGLDDTVKYLEQLVQR